MMVRFTAVTAAYFCAACLSIGAAAATPFVETHYHQYQSGAEFGPFEVNSSTYQDIPGTSKTVTVPAGKAVITWTLGGASVSYAFVRPVIGTHAPNPPPTYFEGLGNTGNLSGTWSTDIEGGSLTVKVQAALSPDFSGFFDCRPDFGTSWTLTVFPPSAEGVPAMSAGSLAVLVCLMLVGGAFVLASRRNALAK